MTTPPPGYVIQAGDTLYSLARKFGVTVADLEAWNPGINPAALRIGSTINVAAPTPPPDPLAELRQVVAGLSDRETALEARVKALEDAQQPTPTPTPPPPAPQPSGTLWGVNASAKGQHDAFGKLLGGVQAWRYYFQNGEGLDNPANAKDGYPLGPGEVYVISFRDFLTVDQIVTALRKLPTDRETYLCWCHEPADQLGLRTTKKPVFTKAQYDDMYVRLRAAQQQVGDHIVIVPILEGVAFLGKNDPAAELPSDPSTYDVMGVDPYFAGSIGQPIKNLNAVLDTYKAAADKLGKPWALGETGVGQGVTGQARLDALTALAQGIRSRGAVFCCYFLGQDGNIQWSLSPAEAAAWVKAATG